MTTKTPVKTSIRKLLEAAGDKGQRVLKRLREADPTGTGLAAPATLDAPMEMAEEPGDPKPEDMMEQARNAQVIAILDDKKLDVPAKLKAIEALLTAHADIQTALGGGGDKPDSPPPEGDKPVSESAKLQARIAELEALEKSRQARDDARKLLESADAEFVEETVEAVALLESTKRQKFIDTLPKRGHGFGFGQRPASSPPQRESAAPVGSYADERSAFEKQFS